MIQRIQTIYIFIAAVLVALLLQLDFAELAVEGQLYVFNAKGIISDGQILFDGLPVMGFIGLITLLHLIIIFLYKKRIRQIRFLSFTILLLLGLVGVMFYFLYAAFDSAQNSGRFSGTGSHTRLPGHPFHWKRRGADQKSEQNSLRLSENSTWYAFIRWHMYSCSVHIAMCFAPRGTWWRE